jgi:hypothetical protein
MIDLDEPAPLQRLVDESWRVHPEREHLTQLATERGPDGLKTWRLVWQDDMDDPTWTELVFEPIRPLDWRRPRVMGRWPKSWLEQQERDHVARMTEVG